MKRIHAAITISLRFPDVKPVHRTRSAQRAYIVCPETCILLAHSFLFLLKAVRDSNSRDRSPPGFKPGAIAHSANRPRLKFPPTVRACHHFNVVTDIHDLPYRLVACGHSRPVPRIVSVLRFHASLSRRAGYSKSSASQDTHPLSKRSQLPG